MDISRILYVEFNNRNPNFLHDSNVSDYAWKIGSLTTTDLSKELDQLKDQKSSIIEHTQELATANYKSFIQTADCSQEMLERFDAIGIKLDILTGSVPGFESKCVSFAESTSEIDQSRQLNTLTLTKSGQLLEILELPQLMDSFIADNLYEDALELAGYVRRLSAKHPDIAIFDGIVREIETSWLSMLHNLIAQLRQDLQLAECLRIISHLRQMEVFTETELRLKFLQSREVYLCNALSAIDETNPSQLLNKIIEITRVNLFNVITQYKAIFSDDSSKGATSFIFFSWINDKIGDFLSTLETHLKNVPADAALGLCMYFGASFSRLGCDFRASLIPIFTTAIADKFGATCRRATRAFDKNMERFTLINKNHPTVPWRSRTRDNDDAIQPPESLLEFYPLAEYLNGILGAFNELRLCTPIGVAPAIIADLRESLSTVSSGISALYGQEQQAFNANSREAFARLCACFADDLIPYLQKCTSVVFSGNNKESGNALAKDRIIEPIKHLLT